MQDQYSEIGDILAKYPDINLEEDTILKDWVNQNDTNRKIFEELTSPDYFVDKLQRLEKIKAEKRRVWIRLRELISANVDIKPVEKKFTWLYRWQTIAAASIILIAGIFTYSLLKNKKQDVIQPGPAVVKSNDIPPGQFKARLTLSNNRDIVLDSATDKVLLEKAGVRIINKNGQLIYEQTGNSKEVLYNTLTTSRGQTYATILSDGTKVWLNSQSSIHYPIIFNGDTRVVEISGEVYFEVMRKEDQPFMVNVSGMDIEVLGTHFNVNSYPDEDVIRTTLLEGKVRVHAEANNGRAILAPGEQAQLNKRSQVLKKANDVDVDAEVAWRFGYFQFVNADLKTVMHQLQRWYNVEVVYQGKVSNDLELIGKIPRSMNLSKVLEVLQTQEVHFKLEGLKIIVLP
jgi:transmembrane sensor